jgi:hypothetical protein
MVNMFKLDEKGSLALPLAIVSFFLVASLSFAIWAFIGRQDFKNNVDQKVEAAVEVAKTEEAARKDAEFAEAEKQPFRTYQGSDIFGSLRFDYPKTWSSYSGGKSGATDLYYYPDSVPEVASETAFALRVQIVSTAYDQSLKTFDSSAKSGKVTVAAFRPSKVPSVLGSRLNGEVVSKKQGSMVLLPLRDKTIKIWTESNSFINDFNVLLESLSYSP